MNFKKLLKFIIPVFLIILSFYIVTKTIAQTDPSPKDNDLVKQGRIRTCLHAQFNSVPPGGGSLKDTSIWLRGVCSSPTGCTCIMNQGTNGAAEGVDGACEESDAAAYAGPNTDGIQVLGESTSLLAKGPPTDPEEIKSRAKKLRNRCQKFIREANDPVIASAIPGITECNVVRNLSANNQPVNNNQSVLGASSSYLPPGPVNVIVEAKTYKHVPVDFSAVGDLPANITTSELGTGENVEGDDTSQKLGQIDFTAADFELSVENLETNCTQISWDPFGRVFDAQSLEPLMDAEVTMIDEITKKPAIMSFNFNYDVTGQDGLFNILVENEGSYSLMVDPPHTHQFVSNPKLSAYWPKIYSDKYLPGDTFIEKKGVATHHDIPLQSKDGKPYTEAVALVIPGTVKHEMIGEYIVYTGRNTFPMAKICLVNEATGKQVGKCVHANNIGKFSIALPKLSVPDKKLLIKAEKVNLNDPKLYVKNQETETLHLNSIYIPDKSASKLLFFEPILSLVEGYAYDGKGAVIPGAKIEVKLAINNEVVYETKADDSGFFTIYNKDLPYLEYFIEYTDPVTGKKNVKTLSQFSSDNKSYIESNKINLVTATKNGQPVINPKTGQLNEISDINPNSIGKNDQPDTITKNNPINVQMMIIVLILILLLVVAAGIAFYIKKSKSVLM